MTLELLFSRGSKLSDVPPDYRGMPLKEWQSAMITQMANSKEAMRHWKQFEVNGEPPLAPRRITTARDEYGMKGLRGR